MTVRVSHILNIKTSFNNDVLIDNVLCYELYVYFLNIFVTYNIIVWNKRICVN